MGSRVYIGGVGHDTRQTDFERFFKGYGHLRDVVVMKGFGFVEFEDVRDAEDAVYELNGKSLNGMRVTVEHARRPSGRRQDSFNRPRQDSFNRPPQRGRAPGPKTGYRLAVENLSSTLSWQDLKDYMRRAGEVTYADAHKNGKNEGIVEFENREGMERALDTLDDTELGGRRIKLTKDKGISSSAGFKRPSRSPSRSRSRSRGRGRRRSRSRSHSRSKSKNRSKSRSRSRSRGRRSKSAEKLKRKSISRSRSRSRGRKRSKSRSRSRDRKRSKSKSRSKSREKARDRSRSKSRSRSRS